MFSSFYCSANLGTAGAAVPHDSSGTFISMYLGLSLLLLFTASNLFAAAPEGIPRELARQRASQISDVRYHLSFILTPHAPIVSGHEEIQFRLNAAVPVLLDFREGAVTTVAINKSKADLQVENGHIALPAGSLQTGLNTVSITFTAPVAPAGKAITRFEDKDDNSEYLYTLFVPMDASMAFPCFDQPDIKGRFHLEITAPEKWTVVSNTASERVMAGGPGQRLKDV